MPPGPKAKATTTPSEHGNGIQKLILSFILFLTAFEITHALFVDATTFQIQNNLGCLLCS